ncbi:RusA family crossover junction endodeoxyribonuclease [Leptothoe sp. LEGE 181152]|nr:RusA family crossover junction endodeoxyribonuclease [Leptothoe sp. LEGE 181152]
MQKPLSLFELLIPRRPVSHQAKDRANLQKWKDFVYGRARLSWQGTPLTEDGLRLTLVYLCDDAPADIDNVIKPIQDALVGVVFADDFQITDVDSHRRFLSEEIDITHLPSLLLQGLVLSQECVYIRVSLAEALDRYL